MRHLLASLFSLCLAVPAAAQNLQLAPLFQDHMVVQRDLPIRVWGQAPAGETVAIEFAGNRVEAQANVEGDFSATLPAVAVGEPRVLVARCRDAEVRCEDVLAGEVWLCSGQSNMAWQISRFKECADDIAKSADSQLRLFKAKQATATSPQRTLEGTWAHCGPETLPTFSAVAYYFGRDLRTEVGVPVGLVLSAWGGTRAEAWTRPSTLATEPQLVPILTAWNEIAASYPTALAAHEKRIENWKQASEAATKAGNKAPRRPGAPISPTGRHAPGTLFHGMIAPLAPFTCAGVIWYQGESNANRADQYRTLFPTMIRDWRAAFGQGDLPFLFVQLAAFETTAPWAELREAQREVLDAVPMTGMAVAIDIGARKNIHPGHKDKVGQRLARVARRMLYGEPTLVATGPVYRGARVAGATMVLSFDSIGKGLRAHSDEELRGFEIAGADRVFHPAQARIVGRTVHVSAEAVPQPAAVRYAWQPFPDGGLFNHEGLPASPFRTDDWPFTSQGKLDPR